MKKSDEIRLQIKEIQNEIQKLSEQDKIDDAYNLIPKVNDLKKKLDIQEKLEEDILDNTNIDTKNNITGRVNVNSALNKALLGKPLTEAENALIEKTGEDGGYLVPVEQKTEIEELKREQLPLKDYCNVIPVKTKSGKMPLEVESSDELTNFDEMEELNQSTIKFGQIEWDVKDYGDIIPVSNTLLQDEKASLTSYIGRRFAKKAVRTENKKIIEVLKTLTPAEITGHEGIKKTINVTLPTAIAKSAKIYTNQNGFDYLDGLMDANGRPLLKPDLAGGDIYKYKGKEIVVVDNKTMPNVEGKMPFFVGDMTSFMAFFDRGVYEVAVSKEAGFTKNATYLRCIERFDLSKVDVGAMEYLLLNTTADNTEVEETA